MTGISMETFYRSVLPGNRNSLAEKKSPYVFLTERHLQAVWWEQRFLQNLKTAQGEEIQVISPGIWNFSSGPDFLKAHVIVNGREVKGDIEIHFTSSDWYSHQHHQDSRYNDVALHVVLWQSKEDRCILTKNGRPITEVFLEEALTVPLEKLAQVIDLDLYPYQVFSGSGKCAQHLFSGLAKEKLQRFFISAAAWRLVKKWEFLSARIEDPSLLLGGGIAMALGYKNNTEIFLRLFLRIYPLRHLGEDVLLAWAMGCTGFFCSDFQKKWGGSDYYRHYHSLYLMNALTEASEENFLLSVHQVRPLNHPLRRLVALVKLVCDPNLPHYLSLLKNLWNESWMACVGKGKWSRLKKGAWNILPSYQHPWWSYHFNFESGEEKNILPLIGQSLKQEIFINTVFPLLYHEISKCGNKEELEALFSFYGSFPASLTSKLKYLKYRFLGDSARGDVLDRADIQQGAYQLHKDFCLHYEASCEGCPFC